MSGEQKTYVIGVGMTKFERPKVKKWDYPDMGREAGEYCSQLSMYMSLFPGNSLVGLFLVSNEFTQFYCNTTV